MKKWMTLPLVCVLLFAWAGCAAAPASTQEPEKTPAATAENSETTAAATTEEALPDAEGAAVFDYAQQEEAALRAQQFWYADMTTGVGAYRYALVDSVAASVVSYEDCIHNEQLRAMMSYGEAGQTPLDRVYAGTDLLVEVSFYVEYEPEINYLGPQYGDGLNAVYILVPADTQQPCEVASGWNTKQIGERMPRPGQTLMAEGLTIYQSRMVWHQCRAMAAAGLRQFTSPADWSEEELYRYLYFRGQDFGLTEETWQNRQTANSYANLILTIDFTAEDDWSSNDRFLPADWPGFTAENLEKYTAGLNSGSVPGYEGEHTGWQIGWEGNILTAKINNGEAYSSQKYSFRTCEGFAPWNGRTYCVEGEPLD